jgi:hypothetical protein
VVIIYIYEQQSEVIKHSQVIDTESKRESNEAPEKILYEKDSRKVIFFYTKSP